MNKKIVALGAAVFGLSILFPAYAVPLSVLNPPYANAQIGLAFNGNQCSQSAGPTACAPGCFIYSCTSLPSVSPGTLQGTTDANGNVQFAVQSYTTGSGYSYAGCGYGPTYAAPFYTVDAYLSGQWQAEQAVSIGINGPWCANPSNPSYPATYTIAIVDYVKDPNGNNPVYANVTVCLVTCSPGATVTQTVTSTTIGSTTLTTTITATSIYSTTSVGTTTYTTTASGTTLTSTQPFTTTQTLATTYTTTSTLTVPVVIQTTQTVGGPTTTQTIVSTVSGQPVTVTKVVSSTTTVTGPTTTATTTLTGTSTATYTQTPGPVPSLPFNLGEVFGVLIAVLGVVRGKK